MRYHFYAMSFPFINFVTFVVHPFFYSAILFDVQIIVVDDKSMDTTVQVVKDYMLTYEGSFVNLVELKVNRGKGGALKAGVEYTRGDYVLMADADAATDINDLDKLFHAMKDVQKIDPSSNLLLGMTIGSRAHLASKSVQTRSVIRTFLMRGFHFLVSTLCSKEIQDTQCGFKLFTRKTALILFRTLNVEGWAFDVELIYLCELFHIPIREVDVNWTEMPGSKLIQHKLDVITTSLSMLRDMLAIRFCYATSLWFLPEDLRKEGMDVVEKNKEVAQGKEGVKIESYIPIKKESMEDEF